MTALVIGCATPHMAGIMCAVAMADILNKRGIEAGPVAFSQPDQHVLSVLRRFGLHAPAVIGSLTGHQIALAGAPAFFQELPGFAKATVIAAVDPASLDALSKANPQVSWTWPEGSTATLLKAMYDFYGMEISRGIAGALLAACLVDTDILTSGTTTDADRHAVSVLAAIAGVAEYTAFGREVSAK